MILKNNVLVSKPSAKFLGNNNHYYKNIIIKVIIYDR